MSSCNITAQKGWGALPHGHCWSGGLRPQGAQIRSRFLTTKSPKTWTVPGLRSSILLNPSNRRALFKPLGPWGKELRGNPEWPAKVTKRAGTEKGAPRWRVRRGDTGRAWQGMASRREGRAGEMENVGGGNRIKVPVAGRGWGYSSLRPRCGRTHSGEDSANFT